MSKSCILTAAFLIAAAGTSSVSSGQLKEGSSGLPLWTNLIDPTAAPVAGGLADLGACGCSGQTSEGEADCGIPADTVNGGCNAVPPAYGTIAVGGSVCGTSQIGTSNVRDTDWYRFTLDATTSVEWVVTAQFPVQMLVLADVCPGALVNPNAVANVPACVEGVISLPNLPAGSYIAFVSPQQGSPFFACESGSTQYVASLREIAPRGSCCVSANTCVPNLTAAECAAQSGTYNGDNSGCGESSFAITTGGGAFASIAGTGTPAAVAGGCDDCTETVSLPFSFSFYGSDYTSASISSNGNLQFGTPSTAYLNDVIPTAAVPNNAIYPFWDDMNPSVTGDIYYTTVGAAPNRQFIVEWNNVTQYQLATSENFQVVLFEGSNNIELRYGAVTAEVGAGDYTIGVENAAGSVATSIPGASIGAGNTSRQVTFVPGVNPCSGPTCGTSDFNGDGDFGTDQDIEAFFACLAGNCCPTCYVGGSDFNGDGDFGTDQDIESFFRVLGGGNC